MLPSQRLEQYSLRCPQEVLLVQVELPGPGVGLAGAGSGGVGSGGGGVGEMEDEVLVFKGFSSSLVNPTAFDPDVPVLPEGARIVAIARLRGPYNPQAPEYLEQGVTWETFEQVLRGMGL